MNTPYTKKSNTNKPQQYIERQGELANSVEIIFEAGLEEWAAGRKAMYEADGKKVKLIPMATFLSQREARRSKKAGGQ